MKQTICVVTLVLMVASLAANAQDATPSSQPSAPMFGVHVVDDQTQRGVPLVELTTISNVRFITDSAGWAAIDDAALIGRNIYFAVKSHGYQFPKDGFGMAGVAVELKPGGAATLKIKRLNIAQRLYRVTGEGIYRDSVMLGKPVPTDNPLLNGGVVGQDSVQSVVFGGKIHWFWGDTNRQRYPLGQFWTSGATSDLPSSGGLDPAIGINLQYYTDKDGFSRAMVDHKDQDPMWLDGLMVVNDEKNAQRLVGRFSKMKGVKECVAKQLYEFNDQLGKFDVKLADLPLDAPAMPEGHPFLVKSDGTDYYYFGNEFPNMRVEATWDAVRDLSKYETYTCLKTGARVRRDDAENALERDEAGRLVWGWKRNTASLSLDAQEKLIASQKMKADETPFRLYDADAKKPIRAHNGSVAWNAFRHKYVGIFAELHGKSSYLGEVWYAEADQPQGPWHWAIKILTHDRYSFYNPKHHAFFDQDGGRIIYFEGTYAATFSRENDPTPRYDYNQIMCRLDLADERLKMP